MMYKALFQAVLLYGSEIWVVTDAMMLFLEGFARQIEGMTAQRGDGGWWCWDLVEAELEVTGL